MELRELRWAIVASQHRSLRQAAETLRVRQSTLSRRLRNLEYRLGSDLFERTNGGTHPTLIGQEFLTIARRIVEEADAAFARLKATSSGQAGRLTIGVYVSLATGNLRATLAEYHRRFPDVDIYTVDGNRDQLLYALANNAVDVAVMTAKHAGWDDRVLPLWSERVIVALHAHHRLGEKDPIYWAEIAGEPILVSQNGPGPELERLLISKLGDYGARRLLHQESGLDRLLSLVAAEYGTLLMLEGATGAHYDDVIYREIHDGDGSTRLNFAAYWRRANGNPTLAPFLAMLRQRYPDLSDGRSQC